MDLSRHIDYTEYIYHIANSGNDKPIDFYDENEQQPILEKFPIFVSDYTNLKELNLSFQFLVEIPDDIGCLQNLRTLRCSDNKYCLCDPSYSRLKYISGELERLVYLETLDLHNNCLSFSFSPIINDAESFPNRFRS